MQSRQVQEHAEWNSKTSQGYVRACPQGGVVHLLVHHGAERGAPAVVLEEFPVRLREKGLLQTGWEAHDA
jgi:hypothetical protein